MVVGHGHGLLYRVSFEICFVCFCWSLFGLYVLDTWDARDRDACFTWLMSYDVGKIRDMVVKWSLYE